MKLTVIPITNGKLGTFFKGLVRGLEELEIVGAAKTIQTTELLRLTRILRRVLETWETFHHWNSSESPSPNTGAIPWEICKKFKFDHANKWYMHNPALVLENDTHKLLWNFDIQTNHLISTRRPDLIIINQNKMKEKKICKIVDFAVPADHIIRLKECVKRNKYLDLARELKKIMEYEGDNYTNCDWCFWNNN